MAALYRGAFSVPDTDGHWARKLLDECFVMLVIAYCLSDRVSVYSVRFSNPAAFSDRP